MSGPTIRPNSNPVPGNTGVKPKAEKPAPAPKAPEKPPAPPPQNKPETPANNQNTFVSGGLDPKTQFEASQGLKNKPVTPDPNKPEANAPGTDPANPENKPEANAPGADPANPAERPAGTEGTEGTENKPGEGTDKLDPETQGRIKELAGDDPELESALTDFATKNPEDFKNAGAPGQKPPEVDPETDKRINDVAGEQPGLSGMLKNLSTQNPNAFEQLIAMLERMAGGSDKPAGGNPPGGTPGTGGGTGEAGADPFSGARGGGGKAPPPTPAGGANAPVGGGNAPGGGNAGGGSRAGGGNAPGGGNVPGGGNAPGRTGGGGGAGGAGGATGGGDSGVPDHLDENGLTAEQLNTTGPAAPVSREEIEQAANGDQEIVEKLTLLDQDPEGHKALRTALDNGTTFKRGELEGNVAGLTEYGGGRGPVITLESMSMSTVAHETAHAAYQDMSHAEVYRFGDRVAANLGVE